MALKSGRIKKKILLLKAYKRINLITFSAFQAFLYIQLFLYFQYFQTFHSDVAAERLALSCSRSLSRISLRARDTMETLIKITAAPKASSVLYCL